MRDGQGSVTAERVAEGRAAHQLLDSPRIFDDPLALRIIDPQAADLLQRHPAAHDRTPFSRHLRIFLAIRSRVAEDELREAIARGVDQYVLLGAGFDTFAYRHSYPALRVFEVDHPATQAVKRTRLANAQIPVPASVTYVPADLSQVSLGDVLTASGFETSRPAVFAWLGVVPYLDLPDTSATLGYIASLARGTAVVFDYGVPPDTLHGMARQLVRRAEQRVAAAGEPFKTFFEPDELRTLLTRAGFGEIEDWEFSELRTRYGLESSSTPQHRSAVRIVKATVA